MKLSILTLGRFSALTIVALSATACGTAVDLLADKDRDAQIEVSSDEETNQNLIDASFSSASGMNLPEFKPFRVGLAGVEGEVEHKRGPHAHSRPGHHKGPRGGHDPQKKLQPLPAEIAELMKAADAKKDSVLGIDRSKVEPILKAMATDLQALRAVTPSREEFVAKAKEIQTKYAEQLKAVLPAFDSLTQEQKDRVKAIHDLQKKVIVGCVVRGADAASETCSTAKSELKANIEAP